MTFEGPDGAGKSTQVELLAAAFRDREPLVVREPGGTPLGERIRELLLHGEPMSGPAEMYLFMAARAELLETRIKPALAAGRVVIDDRYHDSTVAYQGGGRGVEVAWPPLFPKPDLTILLALPAQAGIGRLERSGKELDRLDSESLDFHRGASETYDRLAREEPGRFLRLDASAEPDEIHQQVMRRVGQLL
ncbi:MAG TPA: dTMP kinase [Candidatus Dormibacteraeota bacterium]|nr:dTMP kinase [Candidatus Dormibacteraeota bacterium]